MGHGRKIEGAGQPLAQQGLTVIPLSMYWKRGHAKVELGLARGKREYEKRDSIKKKDFQRERARVLRRGD